MKANNPQSATDDNVESESKTFLVTTEQDGSSETHAYRVQLSDLEKLTAAIQKASEETVSWYDSKIIYRRTSARLLRFSMLVLGGIATLIPLLAQLFNTDNNTVIQPGYSALFVGLVAILFAFERYFGHANAWIRFIRAKFAIQTEVDNLKLDWEVFQLKYKSGQEVQWNTWLEYLKQHQTEVNTIVADETDAWIQEFQAAMKDHPVVGNKKA
jgi:hypothetical protein